MGIFPTLSGRAADNERGVVALEFALVITPLLYICLSIADVGVTALTQFSLDRAVGAVAGALSDGTFTAESGTPSVEAVRTRVCRDLRPALVSEAACTTQLLVGLHGIADAAPVPSAIQDGAVNPAAFSGGALGGSEIMVVRAALPAPRLSPVWRPGLANLADGGLLVVSTAVATPPASAASTSP